MLNTYPENVRWLADASRHYLNRLDLDFEWAVVGTTLMPANFITLAVPPEQQAGQEVMWTFWAWGDTELEIMTNLERIFRNMTNALRGLSKEIRDSSQSVSGHSSVRDGL